MAPGKAFSLCLALLAGLALSAGLTAPAAEAQQRAVSFWLTKDDAERQRNRILHLAGDLREEDNGLWITTRPLRSA